MGSARIKSLVFILQIKYLILLKIRSSFTRILLPTLLCNCIFFSNVYSSDSTYIYGGVVDDLSVDDTNKQLLLKTEEEDSNVDKASKNKPEPKETNITRFFKSWVFTASLGPAWENSGETQTINISPNVYKTYAADNRTNAITELSIFYGVQKPLFSNLSGQIGVNLATISNANMTGEIWDDANPKFNNLNYSYIIKSTRIAAKGIILLDKKLIITPLLSGSVGLSYNYYENFLNAKKIPEVIINPNFAKYTSQAFTYSLGAGFQRNLSNNWRLGVSYEFTDWGHGRLAKAPRQVNFNAITQEHFYTNGLLFNLSYVA